MKKIRYQLINEEAEMPLDFKKRYRERSYEDASVADYLCSEGMQNSGYTIIGTYDDFESASIIITIFSEISSDGCDIEIVNGNKVLFKDSYRYGYNASYNRKYANYAHHDVINAQKYGRTGYMERPYIGDIITELCKKYNIDKHDIIFKQGKNVFTGNSISSKKVRDFINNHIDGGNHNEKSNQQKALQHGDRRESRQLG